MPDPEPFRTGRTAVFALAADPRFSFSLYVPATVHPARVLLALHGTDRDTGACREVFVRLADETGCVVVVPLFPADVDGPDLDGYKYVRHGGVRYDDVLRAVLDQVGVAYGLDISSIVCWGFSGGAQLAERFALVHPSRVRALALGAPGRVTWLDHRHDWWLGLRDTERVLGQAVDVEAFVRVPVHVAVGGDDREPLPIFPGEPGRTTTRVDRLRRFADHLRSHGSEVGLAVVPDVGHVLAPLAAAARGFLRSRLVCDQLPGERGS